MSPSQTLTCWKHTNHKSNEIGHIGHRIMRITRDSLNNSPGCNIIGLLSNTLTECEVINLKHIEAMFNNLKDHLHCKDNIEWKPLQLYHHI